MDVEVAVKGRVGLGVRVDEEVAVAVKVGVEVEVTKPVGVKEAVRVANPGGAGRMVLGQPVRKTRTGRSKKGVHRGIVVFMGPFLSGSGSVYHPMGMHPSEVMVSKERPLFPALKKYISCPGRPSGGTAGIEYAPTVFPFSFGGTMRHPTAALLRAFLWAVFFPAASSVFAQPSVKVFPNPCSGDSVQVEYSLPAPGVAKVLVYNEVGDLVASLREVLPAGPRKTPVNFHYFRRGLYICRVVLTLDDGRVLNSKPVKFTVIR